MTNRSGIDAASFWSGYVCLGSCNNHLGTIPRQLSHNQPNLTNPPSLSDDTSLSVALNIQQYTSSLCLSSRIEILDLERNMALQFPIADSCASCGYGGVDLTPGVLAKFGRRTGKWEDAEFPVRMNEIARSLMD